MNNQGIESKPKIVFTAGCFDLLHVGHVGFLEKARKFGDALVIAIASDAYIRQKKGKHRPIIPESERAKMLKSLKFVDDVYIVSTMAEALKIATSLKIHILVLSDRENSRSIERKQTADLFKKHIPGLIIKKTSQGGCASTTMIEQRILNRHARK